MSNKLSKVFLQELAKKHAALDALDDTSGPVNQLDGDAVLETSSTVDNVPTSASISYDLDAGTKPQARASARKLVSREMAQKIMAGFATSYSQRKGKSLESLAEAIAGTTKVGRRRSSRTKISYALGGSVDDGGAVGALIETLGGKKRRIGTLQPLLEEVMKGYIVKDMTRGGAPLKFRTGRFAESAEITRMGVAKGPKRDTISLFYTYMLAPYSVFDPAVSNYRGLSSAARNPQRIIGQALQNAARDLVSKRYNIKISQE